MSKVPTVNWRCPTCSVTFRAKGTLSNGRLGKTCPNEHWHSLQQVRAYTLAHARKVGISTTPSLWARTEREVFPLPKLETSTALTEDSVRKKIKTLQTLGFTSGKDQSLLALRWWVDHYDNLLLMLPTDSQMFALIDGMFKNIHKISKQLVYPEILQHTTREDK